MAELLPRFRPRQERIEDEKAVAKAAELAQMLRDNFDRFGDVELSVS